MKSIIFSAALFLTLPAFAGGYAKPSKQVQGQTQNQTASGGSAASTSTATAEGGKGGSTDGNAQSVTTNNNDVLQRNNTPDLGSVVVYPTANCRVAYGGGFVGAGFGVQFGSSEASAVCELIELSKRLQELKLHAASIAIMCQEPRAAKAMGTCAPEPKQTSFEMERVGG